METLELWKRGIRKVNEEKSYSRLFGGSQGSPSPPYPTLVFVTISIWCQSMQNLGMSRQRSLKNLGKY